MKVIGRAKLIRYPQKATAPFVLYKKSNIDVLLMLSAISDSSPFTERFMLFPSGKVAIEEIIGSVFLLICALERNPPKKTADYQQRGTSFLMMNIPQYDMIDL